MFKGRSCFVVNLMLRHLQVVAGCCGSDQFDRPNAVCLSEVDFGGA